MISEKVRKYVWERDGGECQLFHSRPTTEGLEIAHIKHQGMGGDSPESEVNQPDNLILVCHECHDKLHGPGVPYQIVRWDPGDPTGGLEVLDREGRKVPHEKLWFYHKQKAKEAKEQLAMLSTAARSVRATMWLIADIFRWFKENNVAFMVGWDNVYEIGAALGYTSAQVKRLIRASKWAEEMGLRNAIEAVDIEVAGALRRVPEEDLEEVLGWFAELPPAEAWEQFNQRYSKERMRTFRVLPRVPVRTVRAKAIEEVEYGPDEMVIHGGSILIGQEQEEVE